MAGSSAASAATKPASSGTPASSGSQRAPVTGNSLREITLDDMHYLGQHQPQLRLVPLVMGFAEAKQGARVRQTMLLGSSNGLRHTHGLELLSGRWLPGEAAEDRPVALLGAVAARELFGQADPVGQWLRFDNRRFRVVGVFTSQSSNLGMDMAEAALIPVGAAQSLFNTQGLFRLIIQPLAGQNKDEMMKKLMDFKSGAKPATIMHQLSKGYTDEQLSEALKRTPGRPLAVGSTPASNVIRVRLDDERDAKLERYMRKHHMSRSNAVRTLLDKALAEI